MFVLPRWVYEKIGGHDPRFFNGRYYGDDDYFYTMKKNNIPVKCVNKVNILHPQGGRTLRKNPNDINKLTEINKALFIEKWGTIP